MNDDKQQDGLLPNEEQKAFKRQILSTQVDLSKFTLADEDEKKQQVVMRESTTFFKDGMKKLRKNYLAMGSIFVLVLIMVLIFIVPSIVPYGYEEVIRVNGKRDRSVANLAPFTYSTLEQELIDEGGKVFPHIMGTDEIGRDHFVRVIYGTRVSLAVGFFASLCGALYRIALRLHIGLFRGQAGYRDDAYRRYYCRCHMLVIILLSVCR